MDAMERRVFLKGAGLGMLAFTMGGADVLMTPGQARAQGVPFRLLNAREAETIEALGETLVPGAQRAGVAHFIDHQVSVPAGEALLEVRIVNVKPPFVNFYRAAIGAVDRASEGKSGRRFAALAATDQHDFVEAMRQNKIDGWQGPPGALVYFVLRSDAVDVVYGTMEGYQQLGVPYMAHIAPEKRW
jgi:gluconate 2-dehydrogenase subunit 3-like protein